MLLIFFFFFFQAEDGIRDADVTGVQTCALPISSVGGGLSKPSYGSSPQAITIKTDSSSGFMNDCIQHLGGQRPASQRSAGVRAAYLKRSSQHSMSRESEP